MLSGRGCDAMLSALISISLHDWPLQQSIVHVTAIYSSPVHLDAIEPVDVNVSQIKRCVDMNTSAWHAGWLALGRSTNRMNVY